METEKAVTALSSANFGELLDIDFWKALRFTLTFTLITLPLVIGVGLCIALAVNNARHGIRVNVIMPGLMDTPMAIEGISRARGIPPETLREERNNLVPLGRQMGTGWDIAYAALYLASDEAKFVTGVVLPIDGGQSAKVG